MTDTEGTVSISERKPHHHVYISRVLSSFVTISSDDNLVQFAHQTVRQYLLSERKDASCLLDEKDSHAFVTRCCLSYLQRYDQSSSKSLPKDLSNKFPLLDYAINNWYRRALKAWQDVIPARNSAVHVTPTTELEDGHDQACHQTNGLTLLDRPPDEFGMFSEHEIKLESSQCLSEWAKMVQGNLDRLLKTECPLCNKLLKRLACEGYRHLIQRFISSPDMLLSCPFDSTRGLFDLALDGEYRDMVQLLLGHYPITQKFDASWWPGDLVSTTDVFACDSHTAIVRSVLETGIDINKKTRRGQTPLHIVSCRGQEALSEMFLAKGADLSARNVHGQTPLHVAAMHGHSLIVHTFLLNGANAWAKDKMGCTPLDYAVLNVISDFNTRASEDREETTARIIQLLLDVDEYDGVEHEVELSDCDNEVTGASKNYGGGWC